MSAAQRKVGKTFYNMIKEQTLDYESVQSLLDVVGKYC